MKELHFHYGWNFGTNWSTEDYGWHWWDMDSVALTGITGIWLKVCPTCHAGTLSAVLNDYEWEYCEKCK